MTDSASDMSLDELEEKRVELVPMPLLCGDKTYIDDKKTPMAAFWQMMQEGLTIKTSQPSPEAFARCFHQAREAGDEVVCVLISSKLSGTFQGAVLARTMEEYEPVFLVDGGQAAASAAEKLLVYRACQLRDEGKCAGEIAADLEAFRNRIRLCACLDTLEYLVRGGRLSRSAANIGTALQLKPILSLTQEGEIQVVKKALGSKRAMQDMVSLASACAVDEAYPVIPLFAENQGNCLAYMEELRKAGLTVSEEPRGIGATIGTYIGPSAYGLAFVEKA